MPFPLNINLGSSQKRDFINLKSIARAIEIPGANKWELWGMLNPPPDVLPITVTNDQYLEIADKLIGEDEDEPFERNEESPSIRISIDKGSAHNSSHNR